ncbi:MAG: XylR N-terminal domain-containing protein [Candidatus Sabulitectum sp.]|nr:XylR N-terminal domain-containing protein [Candidatus Sabulitectum sp.]
MPRYVDCPPEFASLFREAENIITPLFWDFKRAPEEGSITISSERYVIYRGDSMATALRQQLESVLGPGAGVAIYQIGKATGAADAKYYFKKTGIQDPALRLAMGPVAFALGGYANVKILPESTPAPNEDFLLVYDHPNSYEAEAYIQAGLPVNKPIDFLNAGYSAGWCSEAFDLKLEAKEITCKAMGDPQCRFVMAPCSRLRARVKEIKAKYSL